MEWIPNLRQYFLAFDKTNGRLANDAPFKCTAKQKQRTTGLITAVEGTDIRDNGRIFKRPMWFFERTKK